MSHRHLRILAILAVMLAGSLGALQSPDMSSLASAQESQDEAIIALPVRWCAVEGSPSARMAENDLNSINDVLLERQTRANDRIWLPGAEIMFRSAFTAPMIDDARFPIIDDPITPDEGGHGDLGDIFDPREEFKERVQDNNVEGASELSLAIASCRQEWDEFETNEGETEPTTSLMGPIALNIGRFVDRNGNPTQTLGWGGYTTWEPKTSHPCFTPSGAKTAGDGYLAVVDVSVLENVITTDPELAELQLDLAQVDAALLAHEFGHVLYLSHGNGEDDDGNEFYDQRCDLWESPDAPPNTVMHRNISAGTEDITPLQRGTSRDMATIYVGSQQLLPSNHNATPAPAGTPANPSFLSDQRADMAGDVDAQAASIDLTYVELALNESQGTVTLTQGVAGLVGPEDTNAYLAFLDLNEDESGDVATLELPSNVEDEELQSQLSDLALDSQPEGIDLVTMVVVDKDRNATVTVWKSNGGVFIVEPDANVDVQLTSPEGGEEPTAVSDVVTITLPSAIIDTIQDQEQEQKKVGIKTVAANGQHVDVLQRDPSGELAILLLEPPAFPSCEVVNGQVDPGETAELEVTGFGATDQGVLISLGDQVLADGSLDDEISSFELAIPEDAQEGLRLVTVRLGDTALTADCAIQIGEPVPQG